MGFKALQVTLVVLGCVAMIFGALGVVAGAAGIPGGAAAAPNVDSELRFYAAWYVAAGAMLLRVAARPRAETITLRIVCGALVLGAFGRVLSLLTVGRPATVFVVLMAVEFAIAAVVLAWHTAAARRVAHPG